MWKGLTGAGEPDETGTPLELITEALRHQKDAGETARDDSGERLLAILSKAREGADIGSLKIMAIREIAEGFDALCGRLPGLLENLGQETVLAIVRSCGGAATDADPRETLCRMATAEAAGHLATVVDRIASSSPAGLQAMARALEERLQEQRCAGAIIIVGLLMLYWAITMSMTVPPGY